MIEITQGFTSITAGSDLVLPPCSPAGDARTQTRRAPTGARVTLEFSRDASLPLDQPVRVRYEFGDGILREAVGIARPTHLQERRGHADVYHYRLSHWIAAGNVRQRTDARATQPVTSDELRGDPIRA